MNNISKNQYDNCFTAGELASMFGISKQSLLYYDKIHLLSPDFISENGYRHYSITQFLDLEIIVNLRSLDIPINDIQDYLKNRSRERLDEIFRKPVGLHNLLCSSCGERRGSPPRISRRIPGLVLRPSPP